MDNKGFDRRFDGVDTKKGFDIAGSHNHSTKKSKFKRPRWSVVVKSSTLEMSEFSKNLNQTRISDVHDAVREGTLDLIEQAIEHARKNRLLDELDDVGLSNLHHAIRYNRLEAVASLLKNGAQVNIRTRNEENTPLHISSRYGWLEATKLLLEHGADPNAQNINGTTPLHLACRRGNKLVVAVLLNTQRIHVNIPDKSLMIPLHVAAIQGDDELCKMLMDRGADFEAQAADKMTPMLVAVANDNRTAANAILDKVIAVSAQDFSFITKARDVDSNTILHLAALTNNLEIAQKILKYDKNVNLPTITFQTPLHIASVKGHLDMAKLLVSNGADIHAKSFDGRTALHKAATFGHNETVNFLLEKGAVVDARDYANKTPFLVSVESGQTESALLLLATGAKINAYDAMMKNCVHLAVENSQLDTLKALMDVEGFNENLYCPDIQERVPLHYAAMCSNIKVLQVILTRQKRFGFQDENQQTPMYLAADAGRVEHVEELGRAGSPVNERDDEGRSALHAAAIKGHKKVCLKLLKLGADINYRDNTRCTPLMLASRNGVNKTCEELLDNGARIDDVNNEGATALLEAIRYNHVTVVEMLLDSGASILLRNNENMGVIDVAVKYGSSDAAMAICKHSRCREVLDDKSGPYGHSPMKHIIAHFPDAALHVMDRCIYPVEQMSPNSPDYALYYDFTLLDPGPDDPSTKQNNRYFGPEIMVTFHRSDLLLHPLTQKLLKKKWATFGRFLYSLNFFSYLAFLLSFSTFLVLERNQITFTEWEVKNTTSRKASSLYNKSGIGDILPVLIMAFAVIQMCKEVIQMFLQRMAYFSSPGNLLEWALYGTVVVFLIPYVAEPSWVDEYYGDINNPLTMWIIAVISIFLAYVNLVLFLRRFSTLGLYITMHLEVAKTLVKVMVVFLVFIVSFALVFFILFKEQDDFKNMGRSFMKTTIMMLGEIDYSDVFVSTIASTSTTTKVNPKNPFPETAFAFMFLFAFIMCIALMNLLVGLAVGDIDKVQREATLQSQAMQVEFVSQIEDKYPRFITRLVYHKGIVIYPNKPTFFSRVAKIIGRSDYNRKDGWSYKQGEESYKDLKKELVKTKRRVKTIMLTLEAQNRLLRSLAVKIHPASLEEAEDYSGEETIFPQLAKHDFASRDASELIFEEEDGKDEDSNKKPDMQTSL